MKCVVGNNASVAIDFGQACSIGIRFTRSIQLVALSQVYVLRAQVQRLPPYGIPRKVSSGTFQIECQFFVTVFNMVDLNPEVLKHRKHEMCSGEQCQLAQLSISAQLVAQVYVLRVGYSLQLYRRCTCYARKCSAYHYMVFQDKFRRKLLKLNLSFSQASISRLSDSPAELYVCKSGGSKLSSPNQSFKYHQV